MGSWEPAPENSSLRLYSGELWLLGTYLWEQGVPGKRLLGLIDRTGYSGYGEVSRATHSNQYVKAQRHSKPFYCRLSLFSTLLEYCDYFIKTKEIVNTVARG
jgi:hypothetical protein